ncbi:MAG: GNAT family N-acetyltransferase [Chloroflexota bacterium]
MPIEIRNVHEDELTSFVETMSTGFLNRPDVSRIADGVKSLWDLNRVWGAFDAERIRGTLRTWATELTVPGGARIPAAAVTNVTVLPTHRRQGIMRRLITTEHAAARERGESASLLYSAEYPIYGRFGYGPACETATWTVDAGATSFHGPPASGVDFAPPDEATRETLKAVFEARRMVAAGEIRRRDFRWDFDLGLREDAWDPRWKGFIVVHRDGSGRADGYVRYRAREKWEKNQPRNVLEVDELLATTDEAYRSLWRFLVEIDWVGTVVAERRSPAERLPWLLTNARAAHLSDLADGMWVRLLDVPRALEARAYEREASLVLEVVDAEAPGGRIRVRLDASSDGATCRSTTESADLTVGVDALGAAYLGGTSLSAAAAASGADEHRPGALGTADPLLRTLDVPWCATFF